MFFVVGLVPSCCVEPESIDELLVSMVTSASPSAKPPMLKLPSAPVLPVCSTLSLSAIVTSTPSRLFSPAS